MIIMFCLSMKGAAVGLLALKMMDVADWYLNGKKLEFVRQVDLAPFYIQGNMNILITTMKNIISSL